jgi:biotin carboxylase
MKKILILGASILQLPAILKAKEIGLKVACADYDENAVGRKYADDFFCVSTVDYEKILDTVKAYQPDGIMTMATDMPMRTIAYVSEHTSLKGLTMECAINCTDKIEMIKQFKKYGVASPLFEVAENKTDILSISKKMVYPCIMKPADSSGSRGVVLCRSAKELADEYEYTVNFSKSKRVIIEEFMEGNEISVEMFTIESQPYVLQITRKLTTGSPHFVELGHSQPAGFDEETVSKVKELACNAVKAVGIKHGPAHVEIMICKDGPKMVELGARMGGDCITSHLVPLSTGIDMTRATIEDSLGMIPDITKKFNKASAIRYIQADYGIIESITGIEKAKKIPGVVEIYFTKNVGDKSVKIQSSSDRIGYVISRGDTEEEAINVCNKALLEIKVNVLKQ